MLGIYSSIPIYRTAATHLLANLAFSLAWHRRSGHAHFIVQISTLLTCGQKAKLADSIHCIGCSLILPTSTHIQDASYRHQKTFNLNAPALLWHGGQPDPSNLHGAPRGQPLHYSLDGAGAVRQAPKTAWKSLKGCLECYTPLAGVLQVQVLAWCLAAASTQTCCISGPQGRGSRTARHL